jgi:hypothetical protein
VRAALAVALLLCIGVPAQSQQPPQTQGVETQRKAADTPHNQAKANESPKSATAQPPNASHPDESNKHGNQEGTEFWPPFLGIRMKVTDSLLVLFTFVLAIFTGLLWNSTNKLWTAGEDNLLSVRELSFS